VNFCDSVETYISFMISIHQLMAGCVCVAVFILGAIVSLTVADWCWDVVTQFIHVTGPI
jgi:hypothetical protein